MCFFPLASDSTNSSFLLNGCHPHFHRICHVFHSIRMIVLVYCFFFSSCCIGASERKILINHKKLKCHRQQFISQSISNCCGYNKKIYYSRVCVCVCVYRTCYFICIHLYQITSISFWGTNTYLNKFFMYLYRILGFSCSISGCEGPRSVRSIGQATKQFQYLDLNANQWAYLA